MFSKIFKRKVFFPEWLKMLEYAEIGCEYRMILAEGGSDQRKEFLQGKFDLIQSIKNSNSMDSGGYHDIVPLVILGYEREFLRKMRHKIFNKEIYFPSWSSLLENIETSCKYLISLSKIHDKEQKNLHEKLNLIENIKETKNIDSSSYKDITPFVILGYELVSKKKHHNK